MIHCDKTGTVCRNNCGSNHSCSMRSMRERHLDNVHVNFMVDAVDVDFYPGGAAKRICDELSALWLPQLLNEIQNNDMKATQFVVSIDARCVPK